MTPGPGRLPKTSAWPARRVERFVLGGELSTPPFMRRIGRLS
jgi:hypothetical protein